MTEIAVLIYYKHVLWFLICLINVVEQLCRIVCFCISCFSLCKYLSCKHKPLITFVTWSKVVNVKSQTFSR